MSDMHALSLEAGDIVGGYTLVSRLGAGAMGSVWRVVDGGGTPYAMKVLRDSLDDNEELDDATRRARTTARERLRREAMALKRIDDPGVCGIVDMEIDDAVAFIVTELIEGKNLREDVRQNGKYTGGDLERLADKLIDAVRAVHAAGIVHRDIKPTNVMVSVTGPVLVDFGIAMGEGESHVTRTGLVMGTPGFIAPEVIEGSEATEATDWWSTASVLAFAATGEPVFGTSPMMTVLQREATGNANLQGLPPRTLAAFRAALDPDPSRRATPQQLLDAISQDAWNAQAAMPPFDGNDPAGPPPPPRPGPSTSLRRYEDVENPRRLWRAQGMPTALIAQAVPGSTRVIPQRLQRLQDAAELSQTAPAATSPLTETDGAAATTPAPARVTDNRSTPAAATDTPTMSMEMRPAAPPADVIAPTTAMPQGGPTDADTDPASPMATQVLPTNPQVPPQPPQGQADVEPPAGQDPRPPLAHRGRVALALLTIPLAFFAAAEPLPALATAAALLWVAEAVGLNTEMHLRRRGRRAPHLMRTLTFPWHLLRVLPVALLRILVMAIVAAAIATAVTAFAPLPTVTLVAEGFGSSLRMPLPTGAPWSPTGAAMAVALAAGWLAVAVGPHSWQPRLGAGSCVGGGDGRARTVWAVLLTACTVAAAFAGALMPAVDWWPL
nr:serine/threonine-protein kinase [Bifidobacterium cuniculi]